MNIVLIVVLALLAICMIIGIKRGFIKMIFSLVSLVLTIVLVSWVTPYLSELVKEHTSVYEDLVIVCEEKIAQMIPQIPDTENVVELPAVFGDKIQEITQNMVTGESISQQTGEYIAELILNGVIFLATFILISIILKLIVGLLDLIAKLPILKGANRLLGAIMGLIQGLVFVWILMFVVAIACTSEIGQTILMYINENIFLKILYENNLLIYLLGLFLI